MKKKLSKKKSNLMILWTSRIILWICCICSVFPAVWIVSSSLSKGESFITQELFPSEWTFHNYSRIINESNFLTWAKNSLIICISVAIIQLVMSSLGGYAYARMRFKGRRYGLMGLLIVQMFPSTMSIAAIYAIAYRFDLLNSYLTLIFILATGSAFSIWLLKNYIDTVPKEFDEAAIVDGANQFQVFYKVILPLIKPILAVVFLFSFTGVYSDYIMSAIVMRSPEYYTIPLGMRSFINSEFSENWTMFSAGSVMSSVPIILMFVFLQRFIQGGLASSGIKG